MADLPLEQGGKMDLTFKTQLLGNAPNGKIGAPQQFAGFLKAPVQVIFRRRFAGLFLKHFFRNHESLTYRFSDS